MHDITQNDIKIPVTFFVAKNIPFETLIGCDVLQELSAIIDLHNQKVTLYYENQILACDILHRNKFNAAEHIQNREQIINSIQRGLLEQNTEQRNEEEMWKDKVNEMMAFKSESQQPSTQQSTVNSIKTYL